MTGKTRAQSAARGLRRREVLSATGAIAAGAGLGLFGGKAPAVAQQREL